MKTYAAFYDDLGQGGFKKSTLEYNQDGDTAMVPTDTAHGADLSVSRQNQAVIVHSDQYNAGDFQREVALDSEISTWTTTSANPSYPENLLIRFNTDEASTGIADSVNRD